MKKAAFFACVTLALGAAAAAADFQYTEKTEITGGSLKTMMGMAARMSGQGSGPATSTHSYKGDLMATRSDKTVTIIDLGKETFTNVDLDKKEYSVMTFAEMAEAMKRLSDQMASMRGGQRSDEVKVTWKVTADATGKTMDVAGVIAKEIVLKLEMEGQEAGSSARGAMHITLDQWYASVPGDEAVRQFGKRMAEKIAWQTGMNPMMMAQMGPGAAEGLREAAKKMAEMEGMPLRTVTRMGGGATGLPEGEATASEQSRQPAERPSIGGALGGALGGRLGGLGRRRKQEEPSQPPATGAAAAPASAGVLLETTTQVISFSSAPVDASVFQVPAGFKQVESPMKKAMGK